MTKEIKDMSKDELVSEMKLTVKVYQSEDEYRKMVEEQSIAELNRLRRLLHLHNIDF